MTHMTEVENEELARRLTDPATPIPGVGSILEGDAAAAHGWAFMLREYGSVEAIKPAVEDARRHDPAKRASSVTSPAPHDPRCSATAVPGTPRPDPPLRPCRTRLDRRAPPGTARPAHGACAAARGSSRGGVPVAAERRAPIGGIQQEARERHAAISIAVGRSPRRASTPTGTGVSAGLHVKERHEFVCGGSGVVEREIEVVRADSRPARARRSAPFPEGEQEAPNRHGWTHRRNRPVHNWCPAW